ncbi:MAG: phosphotransferase, partial [Candidatus Binataceae bacterium]
MDDAHARARGWADGAVQSSWSGAVVSRIETLRGDASARRFYRVWIEPRSTAAPAAAIAIDLGPDDLPLYARTLRLLPEPLAEPPWTNVHRLFAAVGIAVPELYVIDTAARLLLVEDVGSATLFDCARARPQIAADLYRDAIAQLLLIHVDGTRRLDDTCIASRVAYDARLFRWELDQFLEYGLRAVAPRFDTAGLDSELDNLAARLGAFPRVLSHRDFHGWNLFVRGDGSRIRVIDFQDALRAPGAQDLAVLLTTRDTHRVITPAHERRLLDYYFAGLERRGAAMLRAQEFEESYR